MNTLERLCNEYAEKNIKIYHDETEPVTISYGERYAVFMDFFEINGTANLNWSLGHELGHCATGATHRVGSPFELIQKHEYKANRYFFTRYIPPCQFEDAFKRGITEKWEIAEWFELPEEFIIKAWTFYLDNNLLKNPYISDFG